jgi:uncharacterized RDD family membrane protein YckC
MPTPVPPEAPGPGAPSPVAPAGPQAVPVAPAGPQAVPVTQPEPSPGTVPEAGPRVEPAPPAVYASLGDRWLATFLDLLVFFAVAWAAGMWLAPRFGGLTTEGFELRGWPALAVFGIGTVAFFAYYVCLEWWFGATLGKVVASARVTGLDGGRIDFRQSLVRNLLRLVDAIGVYLVGAIFVILSKKRQRLGDVVARTVVTRRDYPAYAQLAALLVLLALPVAAIAGTWSLRPSSTGASTGTTTTGGTSGSSGATSGASGSGAASRGGVVVASLRDGPFVVERLRAAEGPEGPDRASTNYKPGESTTIRFDASGFDTSAGKGRVRISFSVRDPFGVVMVKEAETTKEPTAGQTSLDGWARFSLPEYAWPGAYNIDLTVVDLSANRQVKASVPFVVEGPPIEPSDTLTLRNFRLTEGDDGPPRPNAAYRKGETLWAAFDVVGFKAGPEGLVQFKEEAAVASGEQHSAPQPLLEVNQRFPYVPRRIPVTNHLTLDEMSPGEYVLTLTFTDGFGNQRYEQAVRFTIQP